jgi:hypothetical protein
MAINIYRRYWQGAYTTTYSWNTETHLPSASSYLGLLTEITYPNFSVVDVYQSGSNVLMAIFSVGYFSGQGSLTGDGSRNLRTQILQGYTGDTQNTLLFKRCNMIASPPTFEFGLYSHTTKDVSVFSYPLSSAPFCSAYSISEDTIIQQSCVGTTLRRVYYDGESGVIIQDTPNSAVCGYVGPVIEVEVTEVKRIKIDHSCYNNPVYLVWKNTLGGWDQWLFSKTQTENLKTESIGEFIQPVYSLSTSDGSTKALGFNAGNTMILGANGLNDNQYLAIKELLYSPAIYKVETDGSQKIVRVKPGSFSNETKDSAHSIEFEILLSDTFTVRS